MRYKLLKDCTVGEKLNVLAQDHASSRKASLEQDW